MEELTWYRQLGNMVCTKVAGSKQEASVEDWNIPEGADQWRCFDLADAMEQGLAKELTSHYIIPPRMVDKEERLVVKRDASKRGFTLTTGDACPLLVAKLNSDSTHYDLYIPSDGNPPCALGPAFTLSSNQQQDRWTLKSARCEQCEWRAKRQSGTRILATFRHYTEKIGDGPAYCMDVDIPEVNGDGIVSAVWCCQCGNSAAQCKTRLTTRRPRWNARSKSLMLNFNGRCKMASSKNFQLQVDGQPNEVALLFGKVEHQTFVLDYKSPLGAVQAFAAALTTVHWK